MGRIIFSIFINHIPTLSVTLYFQLFGKATLICGTYPYITYHSAERELGASYFMPVTHRHFLPSSPDYTVEAEVRCM